MAFHQFRTFAIFKDRTDAGQQLAKRLQSFKDRKDVVVIGLPRGGTVVAWEVAKNLHVPMDLVVPRKIGAPQNEEFAVGAISEDGDLVLDERILRHLGITKSDLEPIIQKERAEAARRLEVYRGNRPPISDIVRGKIAIVVDDGIATGATMKAAIRYLRSQHPKQIIAAASVAAKDSLEDISKVADDVVVVLEAEDLIGIGSFYQHFGQTSDEEVIRLMKLQQESEHQNSHEVPSSKIAQ